jgi:sulfite exporter TauE/SafE/copper chaperone CopZ/plastocyanin domain-containing protein
MEIGIITRKLRIEGMTCVNCQNKIEKTLLGTTGIEKAEVSYNAGTATLTYNADTITIREITSIIKSLDYRVLTGEEPARVSGNMSSKAGILIIIAAAFMLMQGLGLTGLFNSFPLAETGMGYGMLFLIGVVTSVHCIAMCGGINLSQCLPAAGSASPNRFTALRPSMFYNLGRVISYTTVGVIVGALGQVISFPGRMKGMIQLAAGLFMVIMGINMLGLFPALRKFVPRMPKFFAGKIDREKGRVSNPLYVGLLNGLMPCGPLQAMQLYALSTGSPLKGGVSMFLFSMGTVPLMFGLGALSSVLSKKFTAKAMTVGAALVVILGLSMLSYGWALSGFGSPVDGFVSLAGFGGGGSVSTASVPGGSGAALVIEDGVQVVNSDLRSGRYPPITVEAGLPVRWIINAPQGTINGCNNRMIIPEYNIQHSFKQGENVIEFTPKKTGVFRYSCWMGMIRSTITVVESGTLASVAANAESGEGEFEGYSEWDEITEPVPAGFRIPANELAIGTINEKGIQTVTIELSDRGFSPAAVVLQAGLRTSWTITNTSTRPENFDVRFPVYGQEVSIDSGENTLALVPQSDVEFFTADSEYYGYVKIVDDINNLDIDGIKSEISGYETMVYPDDYFGSGMSCCN